MTLEHWVITLLIAVGVLLFLLVAIGALFWRFLAALGKWGH